MGAKRAKHLVEFTDLEIDELRELLWNAASTYPRSILKRRLNFLTQKDRKAVKSAVMKINDLEDQIEEIVLYQIDEIIGNEAEKRNDPWK